MELFWFVGVFFPPFGFVFLRIIIKISFLMSLNIPNFSIFEALSHEATDFPFYCESFLNSTFALLLLLTLWILSLFPYHSSLHCSDFISQRASSIFYGHREGIKRTKEDLESGANVDHAETGTYENLVKARRCGNKGERVS